MRVQWSGRSDYTVSLYSCGGGSSNGTGVLARRHREQPFVHKTSAAGVMKRTRRLTRSPMKRIESLADAGTSLAAQSHLGEARPTNTQ
ncbi:hypothetical protein E2C01_076651 [Portunus trituberculatus]|uniref:Uncharacterized protein n=1 Tax=Portunus trituberculatus TaxID=210409 RepID=A0A5B7IJ86_PORTR|nr:hypothetical protein [Portunus trituberculatus]